MRKLSKMNWKRLAVGLLALILAVCLVIGVFAEEPADARRGAGL